MKSQLSVLKMSKDGITGSAIEATPKVVQRAPEVISCLAYGIVSVSITLFNKAIFSVYKFEYPTFVTLVQIVLSIFFMVLLSKARVIDFKMKGGGGILGLKWTTGKRIFPLAFFWMLYVQSGLLALRYLTVPMFGVLRRSTTLITVLGEYLAFGKVTPASSMAAILVMVAGAALAGATDLSFNAAGYAWVSVCILSTAAFLILIRMLGNELKLNQHALLLYNNALSLPMMLAWFLLATDEPKSVFSAPQWLDPSFLAFLLLSASQAFLLNLCMFWCTTVTSALVTTVVGEYNRDFGHYLFGSSHSKSIQKCVRCCLHRLRARYCHSKRRSNERLSHDVPRSVHFWRRPFQRCKFDGRGIGPHGRCGLLRDFLQTEVVYIIYKERYHYVFFLLQRYGATMLLWRSPRNPDFLETRMFGAWFFVTRSCSRFNG